MSHQATGWVLEFSESRLGARLVLHEIAYRMNNDSEICYPSLETIAHECRMSKSSVIEAIERLEQSGEVTVDRTNKPGAGSVNKYSMPEFFDWWNRAKQIGIKGRKGPVPKEKGPVQTGERVGLSDKKGSAALPELSLEPSLELEGGNKPLFPPIGTAKQKPKKQPKVRIVQRPIIQYEGSPLISKESYVQSQPKRTRGEEQRDSRRAAIEDYKRSLSLPRPVR